jgi:type VI secretion system protein ImpM
MMPSQSPGFFGKFPVRGDFISRRLPADFIRSWDAWLQGSLVASREILGESWLSIYLTSPLWRFILNPGVCGPNGWMGVLMPSVDRVGRYFPLTLAIATSQGNGLASLFVSAADWFARLEHLALSCLEDDFDFDAFDQQLQQQAPPAVPDSGPLQVSGPEGPEDGQPLRAMHVEMRDLDQMPEAIAHLGSSLLAVYLSTYSLWSTSGSERVQPCLLLYPGLPPAASFADLISGQWPGACRQGKVPAPAAVLPEAAGRTGHEVFSAARPARQWRSSAMTTVGKVRKKNEDAYLDQPAAGLWAVADGMGGHWAGELASKTAVEALATLPVAGNDLENALADAAGRLRAANDRLLAMAEEKGMGRTMGSTVVAMLATENRGAAIWAGDSRLYRLRGQILTQLTRDHSLAEELARQGTVAMEAGGPGINTNVITRAVGAQPELLLDTITFQAEADDVYLLCSDGLVREVQDEEISSILRWHERDRCARALVELALERGARDNVTVVVVWPEPAEQAAPRGSAA